MVKIHGEVKRGDSVMLEVDYDTLKMLRILTGACIMGDSEMGRKSHEMFLTLKKVISMGAGKVVSYYTGNITWKK